MNNEEYLAGSARQRFKDLRDRENLTQEQLAEIADVQVSTISKIESGATKKIASTILEKIADHFDVTTYFLLGRVDVPDKTSYQIEQLGLSVTAAKNLYTGRVNPDIVNVLLENKRFAQLSYNIDCYIEDRLKEAFVAQNQMLLSASKLLRANGMDDGAADMMALRDVQASSYELDKLSREFVACLKDIKSNLEAQLTDTKKLVSDAWDAVVKEVTHGGEKELQEVTQDDMMAYFRSLFEGNLDYMSKDEVDALVAALKPAFAPVPKKESKDD